MASLAGMLQAGGHRVTGSDQNVYPPMSTQLEALGIEILNGYKAENADIGADVTVVGNAISRGNAELEEVLNRKLMYRSQAEIVNAYQPESRHEWNSFESAPDSPHNSEPCRLTRTPWPKRKSRNKSMT